MLIKLDSTLRQNPWNPFTSQKPFNYSYTEDGYVWYWTYYIAAKLEPEYTLNKLATSVTFTPPITKPETWTINEARAVEGHPSITSLYSGLGKRAMFVNVHLLAYLLKKFPPEYYTYLSDGNLLHVEKVAGIYAYLAAVSGAGL